LESKGCAKTQLHFCTPGILLRQFQFDPTLSEYTHVILDEIHERDQYTEFLMIVLRDLLNRRKDLHIILMSATIQTNELLDYWQGAGSGDEVDDDATDTTATATTAVDNESNADSGKPAEICIPGRTFPVQEFFLEDALTMTGFVGDQSEHFGGMKDLESDLSALLGQRRQRDASSSDDSNGSKKKTKTNSGKTIVSTLETTFKCIMCDRSDFRTPEELGSHVALCTGGGQDMLALEEKVLKVNPSSVLGTDCNAKDEECEDMSSSELDKGDDKSSNDNDDDNDLVVGKWDGESPFAVTDVVAGNKTTITEEEMLSRYQAIHDDEVVDTKLILEVVKYVDRSSYGNGAILIFLPGWQEISEVSLLLEKTHPFSDTSKYSVLPLHSGIPSREQRLVFQRPKEGVRKIVLSTNIAETSVTIDDVAFVVDTGKAKEKNYDPHLNSSTLQPMWISQASAKQRKGRAGRTKAGVCFHLFSRRRHETFRPFLDSELLRTPLEEVCLQCKKLNLAPGGADDINGIPAFLSAAMSPPHPKSVANALELLVSIGAMDFGTNDLTDLGHCLSMLSCEPRVGKMVIWSYILGCAKVQSYFKNIPLEILKTLY
jgi:HrpA-like RNA helicase